MAEWYCKLHGDGQKVKYLYAKAANGKICVECIRAGLWNAEITAEIKRVYPEYFLSGKPSEKGDFNETIQKTGKLHS